MRQITLYQCETCGTQYKFPQDCQSCEKFHEKPQNIESLKWQPFNQQSADKYPIEISVKMLDGKIIRYRR